MKSGELRHTVIVQTPAIIEDTNGGHTNDWSEVGTYKASIRTLSVRERFLADQQHASATHELAFRFYPELAALTGKERVVIGHLDTSGDLVLNRIFILIGLPVNVNERNREIRLLCEEGLREE